MKKEACAPLCKALAKTRPEDCIQGLDALNELSKVEHILWEEIERDRLYFAI